MLQQPRQSSGPQVVSSKTEIRHERGRTTDVHMVGMGGMAQGMSDSLSGFTGISKFAQVL